MIYRKSHANSSTPGGYFHLEEEKTRTKVYGYGHGDYIRLMDEYGNIWSGSAERSDDNSVRYRFRDSSGRTIAGASSSFGIVLRDGTGNTWKGFVD